MKIQRKLKKHIFPFSDAYNAFQRVSAIATIATLGLEQGSSEGCDVEFSA